MNAGKKQPTVRSLHHFCQETCGVFMVLWITFFIVNLWITLFRHRILLAFEAPRGNDT